ncbi:MAG: hypothetical protein QM758_28935 [Armatimonas sp.]
MKTFGGFCLGFGITWTVGVIVLLVVGTRLIGGDEGGWYGPLKGLIDASIAIVIGLALFAVLSLLMGARIAFLASRSSAAWPYLGFVAVILPLIILKFYVYQSAREGAAAKAKMLAVSAESNRMTGEHNARMAERLEKERLSRSIHGDGSGPPPTFINDPINKNEVEALGRCLGDLYFPHSTIGVWTSTRTEPPTQDWPRIVLICPKGTTQEAAVGYYRAQCVGDPTTPVGANIRRADGVEGKLYISTDPKTALVNLIFLAN